MAGGAADADRSGPDSGAAPRAAWRLPGPAPAAPAATTPARGRRWTRWISRGVRLTRGRRRPGGGQGHPVPVHREPSRAWHELGHWKRRLARRERSCARCDVGTPSRSGAGRAAAAHPADGAAARPPCAGDSRFRAAVCARYGRGGPPGRCGSPTVGPRVVILFASAFFFLFFLEAMLIFSVLFQF